jgi:hypothetical protein
MTRSTKPSLLEQLREKSEAIRASDAAARKSNEKARQDINRHLWHAFQWLDEAADHLGVIRPVVTRQFPLGDLLTIDNPQFDRGFVAFRRRGPAEHEALDHIELHCKRSVEVVWKLLSA